MRSFTSFLAFIVIAVILGSAGICAEEPETFGAAPDALGPIGGGRGYKKLVIAGHYRVKTEDELLDALKKAKPGEIVYVDDSAELDFTVRVKAEKLIIEIPAGVTLASGRGHRGSKGALIFSDTFETHPLIQAKGENVRITGLRIRGPDPKPRWLELPRLLQKGGHELYYAFPVSSGIKSEFPGIEVDNCEIWAWSAYGINVTGKSKGHIHHNYIHHCRRRGLGYGVEVDGTEALIESNIFDNCRHSVASTGSPGSCYEARNNIIEENGILSSFDMHGGRDRGDGTNIAGDWIKVHHNTFKGRWQGGNCVPAVGIRGVPTKGGEIHHNWFCAEIPEKALFKDPDPNVRVYRNQYGPKREIKD